MLAPLKLAFSFLSRASVMSCRRWSNRCGALRLCFQVAPIAPLHSAELRLETMSELLCKPEARGGQAIADFGGEIMVVLGRHSGIDFGL